ncbi:MAG: DUF4416 family protein [Calditrichia bacterium]
MGRIKVYPPVKYIAAITFQESLNLEEIVAVLKDLFSAVDSRSEIYPFSFTDYYEPEMGVNLQKLMVSFGELRPAEFLPEAKLATNEIEKNYSIEGNRRVNIDPGYICAAKLVLATTKDYDHRIYLGRGIFGDVHLRFRNKYFAANDWTYPDYRQPQILEYFTRVRNLYLKQLAELSQI